MLVAAALPAAAQTGGLDAKRGEAAQLRERIARQGERMSIADEEFNQAAEERRRIDRELEGSREDLAAAENQWHDLKAQLGRRARAVYKHPGAWLETFFGAKSMAELTRGRALAGSVLVSDTELLHETDNARREVEARAESLTRLRSEADRKEDLLAQRRQTVESELRTQQSLLASVEGDIAEVLEAERQRELEEARRLAQAAAQRRAAADAPRSAAGTGAPSRAGRPSASEEAEEPRTPARAPRATAAVAVQTARDQIGKPYRWGAEGPDAYDCSGLTKYAWGRAGVSLPHSSQAQYNALQKVSKDQLQPGDLVFFGNPIHHVGIYEGDGIMINAPQTGESVRRNSIHRRDYRGAARP
jgi:cell wall-associated NlpC family hydrolase